MRKICPTCGAIRPGIESFCRKCGVELVNEPNRCSAEKTALCRGVKFDDEDRYCPYWLYKGRKMPYSITKQKQILAVEHALRIVPPEYQRGILDNIIKRRAYPNDGHRNTYGYWKQRFIYQVAAELHLI